MIFFKPISSAKWDATNDQALLLVISANQKWIGRDHDDDFFLTCVFLFFFFFLRRYPARLVPLGAGLRNQPGGGGVSTFRNACDAKWGYLAPRQYI